jgi:peptide/nickel transport system substrate-binding protein
LVERASGVGRSAGRATRSPGRALVLLLLGCAVGLGGASSLGCRRTGSPSTEQVFRFRIREDPPTLDPALSSDNLSEAVLVNLFRGLVQLDPATLEVSPAVASSWTISPDRRTYTFHLRDDATFHNGRRVVAGDAEYSFQRILRKETASPRRIVLEPIEGASEFAEGRAPSVSGIKVRDDRTLEIRLARPFAPFLSTLTIPSLGLVPREVYDDPAKGYLRSPVGCGPFRFAGWEQSNFITLTAFDRYFGGRPSIDRVIVRIIENKVSALQEYRAGGLDSLDQPPDRGDDALYKELEPEIKIYPYIATGYIGFNLSMAPFKGNVKLRQAINCAIDKKRIWESILPGAGIPAHGIIPPGIPGYDPDLAGYPHDEERARRLLAEAGHAEGRGLAPIALWINTSEDNRKIAEQIQADLKRVGIGLTIHEIDWSAYLAAIEGTQAAPGPAPMFRFGWNLDYPDADSILWTLLHSSNWGPSGNYFRYKNPEFDRLVEEARAQTDPAARALLYRKAERIAVDDAPMVFLNYFVSTTLFKPYVDGIVLTPLGEFRIPLERLRIAKHSA